MQKFSTYHYAKSFLHYYKGDFVSLISQLHDLDTVFYDIYPSLKKGINVNSVTEAVSKSNMDSQIKQIILVMMQNKQLHLLSDAIIEIQKIHFLSQNYEISYIESSNQIDSKIVTELEQWLNDSHKTNKIKLVQKINPNLLWGVVVKFKDKVLDISGASFFKKIKNL